MNEALAGRSGSGAFEPKIDVIGHPVWAEYRVRRAHG
jgi:hypothetical protein